MSYSYYLATAQKERPLDYINILLNNAKVQFPSLEITTVPTYYASFT